MLFGSKDHSREAVKDLLWALPRNLIHGKESILKLRLLLCQNSLVIPFGGEYEKLLGYLFPQHSSYMLKTLVQCHKQHCSQCSVSQRAFAISCWLFLCSFKITFPQNHYHYRVLFTLNSLQVKTHKVLKQTLWKVPISSVILIFKIFASGIQDTVDCLLYYVNLQKKTGHSSNCLLVKMWLSCIKTITVF